jgi:hypothetical protein
MSSEETGDRSPGRKAAVVRPGQVVRSSASRRGSAEVRLADGRVLVTVFCPDIPEEHLRYAVGSRYVIVWSADPTRDIRQFIHLPVRVVPPTHEAAYRNGVFDLAVDAAR